MWEEKQHRHQPARRRSSSTPTPDGDAGTSSCSWPRAAARPTSRFLFQETKALLNPTRMLQFLDEKLRSLGTAACPPYHLAS